MRAILILLFVGGTLAGQIRGNSAVRGNAQVGQLVGSLPTSGLVAWWELINSAGGTGHTGETIADSSGNGNTITITGPQNPIWPVPSSKGLVFGAGYFSPWPMATLSLAGSSPKTVIVVFNSLLNGTQGYMLGTSHIYPDPPDANGVFLEYLGIDTYGKFSIVPDVTCAANPRAAVVPDNTWSLGVIRYPGTGADYTQNLNLDAAVIGAIDGSCGTPTTMTVGPNVTIGGGNTMWQGTIAEALIYSRVLSNTELTSLYAYFKTRLSAVGITLP